MHASKNFWCQKIPALRWRSQWSSILQCLLCGKSWTDEPAHPRYCSCRERLLLPRSTEIQPLGFDWVNPHSTIHCICSVGARTLLSRPYLTIFVLHDGPNPVCDPNLLSRHYWWWLNNFGRSWNSRADLEAGYFNHHAFTVAILAQGTPRGDAFYAALFFAGLTKSVGKSLLNFPSTFLSEIPRKISGKISLKFLLRKHHSERK